MIARNPQANADQLHDMIIVGGGIYSVAVTLEAARRVLRPRRESVISVRRQALTRYASPMEVYAVCGSSTSGANPDPFKSSGTGA